MLLSANRRDREPLAGRMDVMAMALSGRDGGADWPQTPCERGGDGLLVLLLMLLMAVLLMMVVSVLCERKLRVKRLSSLVRREAASLKDCRELQQRLVLISALRRWTCRGKRR